MTASRGVDPLAAVSTRRELERAAAAKPVSSESCEAQRARRTRVQRADNASHVRLVLS
jgi:hypothetical protein